MTKLIVLSKDRLPGYLVYPVSFSALEQAFVDLPQETISVQFSVGNLKRPPKERDANDYRPGFNALLSAQHHAGSNWRIGVCGRYPDRIAEIRSTLIEHGLPKLKEWFIKADLTGFSKPGYISHKGWCQFIIGFDGNNLVFSEPDEWRRP